MKKLTSSKAKAPVKSPGTRIVEKYRPRMNALTETDRKRLLDEGLAIIFGAQSQPADAHRR